MKRFLLIVLAVCVVAIGLLFIPGVRRALGFSASKIIAQQIERIAADYLNPDLLIGEVTYTFPTTVGVRNLTLTQNEVTILDVPSGSITLVHIPISSGKVRFRNFVLESPVFRMVVDKNGNLVGWDNLLKTDEDRKNEGREDAKASDSFAIRDITVTNATIEYKDLRTGSNTMRLDEFDFHLKAQRAREEKKSDAATKGPSIPTTSGWYQLKTTIDRSPLIAIDIDAGLNIDNGDLVFRSLKMQADLDRSNDHVLPPQIQSFVQEYSINGSLDVMVSGTLLSDAPLDGPIDISIELADATIGKKEKMVHLSSFHANGTLRDALLQFDDIKGELLDGSLEADLELRLADAVAASDKQATGKQDAAEGASVPGKDAFSIACGLQLNDINLRMLTGSAPANDQLEGLLNLDIESAGIVTQWPQTLKGEGELTIKDGRLASIPVISVLGRAMRAVLLRQQDNDSLHTSIQLRSDGVVINNLSLIAGLMAVRGRGIIRFNNTINLIVNGGPLERVQKSLGRIGRALGNLTDRIVRYHIVGSLQSPEIQVRPLGIGTGDPTAPPEEPPSGSGSSP